METKEFGEDFPLFLFVLSLFLFLLLSTVLSSLCSWEPLTLIDTVTAKAKQYQECNTLVTRIEVRIMRLRREKGDRKQGALQTTQDPNVPNNNTGIILSIIPVLILGIIYYSSSIENTASIIYYCTFTILML